MRFIYGLLFSLACSLGVKAQQQHFVYIQTENNQPFYVQIDSIIYSSSASGYVILPYLQDTAYTIAIGFPKSEWPQQHYSFSINDSDYGYVLKYAADQWVLSNLQTADVILPNVIETHTIVKTETRSDPFATMLSNAVNDPSIKQETYTEEIKPNKPIDSIKYVSERSAVTKIATNKVPEGIEMIYVDRYDNKEDTVRIIVADQNMNVVKTQDSLVQQTSAPIVKEHVEYVDAIKPMPNSNEEKVLNVPPDSVVDSPKVQTPVVKNDNIIDTVLVSSKNNVAITSPVVKKDSSATNVKPVMVNSECTHLASMDDFIKLRRKMANQTSDNEMLDVAKKIFRTRCFMTAQIKNMGALFFSDRGRYDFFEAAYEIVADEQNYGVLKIELNDPYYIARFEAMVHH
jgi:uncharacterized protein DUF4476